MDIGFVIRIAAVGLLTAVINQVLSKAGKDEYSLAVTLSGLVVALLMLLPQLKVLIDSFKDVFGF